MTDLKVGRRDVLLTLTFAAAGCHAARATAPPQNAASVNDAVPPETKREAIMGQAQSDLLAPAIAWLPYLAVTE